MGPDLIEFADRVVPLGHSSHMRVCTMWLERIFLSPEGMFLYAPKSEKARGAPIRGMDSRLEVGLKSFPLLLRLSRARFTSIWMSVEIPSNWSPDECLGLISSIVA